MKAKTIFFLIIMLTVSLLAYAGTPNPPVPTCVGCGRQITTPADHAPNCPYGPKSGGSGYSGGSMETQMMQSILQPFFNNLFALPDTSGQDEIERQNAIKLRQQEEADKKAAQQRWLLFQTQEDLQRKMEKDARIKQGEELLLQMQTVGSGGKPEPFSVGNPKLDLKPLSQGTYPTAHFTAWERLLGAAYFSSKASQSTVDVDASFYADEAQRVMSGEPTYMECKIPQVSNEKLAKRIGEVKKLYDGMNVKIKDLQEIENKISESKEKIKNAELKKEDATVKLNELQTRAATAKPEEKAEIDDLAAQAQEQLQNADQELNQAKQSEKDALNKKEQLGNEIKNIQSQMQTKIQAGDK